MLRDEIDSLAPTRDIGGGGIARPAVGVGFAASVTPVTAQTITTDTTGLTAGAVTIPVGDFNMPAYCAQPAGKTKLPVILVVSEIFGVHEHIADVARRFAKLGYLAIAPELFVRQGDAKAHTDIPKLISDVVGKAPDAQVMGDLDAAVAWANAHGGDAGRLGVTGFCWGGRTVWMYAAHNPGVKAGVAWYGPTARAYHPGDKPALDVAGRIKAAMLGLYGGADPGIPGDTVEKMRDAVKAAGNPEVEVVIYPDTPHAFHADYRPSYRKEAAEDGWKRCVAWLRAHV